MSDRDEVIKEVKQRCKDMDQEKQKLIFAICSDLVEKGSEISTKTEVSNNLSDKVEDLMTDFKDAYSKLLNKMGL